MASKRILEELKDLQKDPPTSCSAEAEVLSAPLKLVYGKLLLRFTRKLLVATVDKSDEHVLVIDKVAPSNWKAEPAGRILEFSILHLAMSEISMLKTRHQFVINEDVSKEFKIIVEREIDIVDDPRSPKINSRFSYN